MTSVMLAPAPSPVRKGREAPREGHFSHLRMAARGDFPDNILEPLLDLHLAPTVPWQGPTLTSVGSRVDNLPLLAHFDTFLKWAQRLTRGRESYGIGLVITQSTAAWWRKNREAGTSRFFVCQIRDFESQDLGGEGGG